MAGMLTARRHKKEIGAVLLFPLLVVLPLAALLLQRLQVQTPQEPSEEQDPYYWPRSERISSIFLRSTGASKSEPTFVWVHVKDECRMGGLWGACVPLTGGT
jgi:hypothetical protein